MALFIGILPAIFWGILPIWIKKIAGGNFKSQLLGTTLGIAIVALIFKIITQPNLSMIEMVLFFGSGFFWSFGQAGQYFGYEKLGVSVTMPLSTSLQIIGNSIIGGVFLREWANPHEVLLGLFSLVIILAGVFLTNGKLNIDKKKIINLSVIFFSTIGYWLYSLLPTISNVTSALDGFFYQSIGMLLGACVVSLNKKSENGFEMRDVIKNISSGIIFSVAAASYLVSLSLNGLVNAFVLTQLNVVISTLLGILMLREKANMRKTIVGLLLIVIGAYLTVHG